MIDNNYKMLLFIHRMNIELNIRFKWNAIFFALPFHSIFIEYSAHRMIRFLCLLLLSFVRTVTSIRRTYENYRNDLFRLAWQ